MNVFAERLKIAIEKRGLSQAEAAKLCGITQQSINYIITNRLASSKLAPQIATGLGINPEWLIWGRGKFEEMRIYELPIIHSLYMLRKFLNHELNKESLTYTVIETDIGTSAFAYLLEPRKMVICYESLDDGDDREYLTLTDNAVMIGNKKEGVSFSVYEWRIRNADF